MKVIKIGAVWCNGCLVMRPRWQEIEKELPWLETHYYDFDADQDVIAKYSINSGTLPVFIFLDKAGNEIKRLTGEIEKEALYKTINDLKNN